MKNPLAWLAAILLLAALAWWLSVRQDAREMERVAVQPAAPEFAPATPETPRYPVPEPLPAPEPTEEPVAPPEPLPPLEDSDPEMQQHLASLVGAERLATQLAADFLVNRAVATIDALTTSRVSPRAWLLQPPPGTFQVMEAGDAVAISPSNAARYEGLVATFLAVDIEQGLPLYRRYYPLLQQSYEELGYPDAYFNDRLVDVIDHLLLTPEPRGVLELVPNEANYDFADPELQALSAGQKLLLRLDADSRARVRERLQHWRSALAGLAPTD